ncbi:2-hydroxyacid dehydrogenase [Halomonas sp. McH1-25]|uniref:2-hydroxyacid dehydrogenase n=1 Tax=unclassified Halomonas TaxID=2609666 RepID=UPI001EF4B6AF|nr:MULTISPECIES: 2-hydroxyacid dehydrogenase [unclassified Halomonas]MCG7599605.1 2-hydroxyacid dehydrogenase [Halomonas sp. McH1-25]MCP1342122.1 2-hydroxyacid dehydrogenase [Halomonas sp. FL8]MCP1363188.1 2-hydroxyacid dehydrogenase [Halomonas sp. BBD45]MCP1366904.1 2-hydroxyacid dehydrogenase [Halomonas sp. BBD48]
MRVTVYSAQPYDRQFLEEVRAAHFAEAGIEWRFQAATLNAGTVALAKDSEAVCVFVNDVLDAEVLEALAHEGVRAVVLRCAGYNNVDLDAAKRLGLFVARVPAYSPEAVAEHAMALIMTLNRKTHRAYNRVREGNFSLDGLLGSTLHGKTAGVVGTGRIGLVMARLLQGFGCRVLGYDPFPNPAFDTWGERVDLDTLLAQADIVSLHCPLTEDTYHLIDAPALARMKPGAMLVNTSRGALIDTQAVIEALKSRQLSALAIDVYEQESELFFHDHSAEFIDDDVFARLMTFPNVLVTGHQGFFTTEALREIAEVTCSNLIAYRQGESGPNRLA